MKHLIITTALTLACVCTARANPTERPASAFYTNITNLWTSGQHSNVLTIANARLATNQNDIVGLVLKASWDFKYATPAVHAASHAKMLQVGKDIKTPIFTRAYKLSAMGLQKAFKAFAEQHPDDAELKEKLAPMAYFAELYALDQDGLLQ